jgi:hypothetical protein
VFVVVIMVQAFVFLILVTFLDTNGFKVIPHLLFLYTFVPQHKLTSLY